MAWGKQLTSSTKGLKECADASGGDALLDLRTSLGFFQAGDTMWSQHAVLHQSSCVQMLLQIL